VAHIKESRLDFGLGFQVEISELSRSSLSSVGAIRSHALKWCMRVTQISNKDFQEQGFFSPNIHAKTTTRMRQKKLLLIDGM